jgi:hypothetical protein
MNLGTVYLLTGEKSSAKAEYEMLKKLDAERAERLLRSITEPNQG